MEVPPTRRDPDPVTLDDGRLLDPVALRAGAVLVVGCALLVARPALVAASPHGAAVLVVVFLAVGAAGAWVPLPAASTVAADGALPTGRARKAGRASGRTTVVVLVGVGAFVTGRIIGGGHPPVPATLPIVAANTLAAVAEEAFFRRLCFGLLRPAGVAWAVIGSAGLFAVVHVTTYGWWVLPLDLTAGLIFGWQRATTGSWRAPAITHVLVNLLVVL